MNILQTQTSRKSLIPKGLSPGNGGDPRVENILFNQYTENAKVAYIETFDNTNLIANAPGVGLVCGYQNRGINS